MSPEEVLKLSEIIPKRFGLKYDPPQLILEYLERDSGRLFHRVIPVSRSRLQNTECSVIAEKLRTKNSRYLKDERVNDEQLLKLLNKLKTEVCNNCLKTLPKVAGLPGVDYDTFDLNKLSKEEVQLHKDAMDQEFKRNQKSWRDSDFTYDVREDFDGGDKVVCDWDDEDD